MINIVIAIVHSEFYFLAIGSELACIKILKSDSINSQNWTFANCFPARSAGNQFAKVQFCELLESTKTRLFVSSITRQKVLFSYYRRLTDAVCACLNAERVATTLHAAADLTLAAELTARKTIST